MSFNNMWICVTLLAGCCVMISLGVYYTIPELWQAGAVIFNIICDIFIIIHKYDRTNTNSIGISMYYIIIIGIITGSIYMIVHGAVENNSQQWKIGVVLLLCSWIIGCCVMIPFALCFGKIDANNRIVELVRIWTVANQVVHV